MSPRKAAATQADTTRNCPKCAGTGKVLDPKNPTHTVPCPSCRGSGRVNGQQKKQAPRRNPPSLPRYLDKDTLKSMKTICASMSTATKDLTSLTRFDISDVDQRAKVLQKLATLTRLHGQWVSRVESAHHKEGLNRLASQTRDLAQDILDSLPEEGDTRRLNRLRDKLSELTTASPPLPKP